MKKKILIIVGSVFVLLLVAIVTIPIIFKDDIKKAIDEQIAQYIDADVNYKADDFSLSIFSNFPNVTARLDNFSIVGRNDFKGDTLTSIQSFRATIDLWSVLFGDEMKIKGVSLTTPRIFAKVNKAGKANWDIVRPQPLDTTQKEEVPQEEAAPLKIAINKWEIINGLVVYDDKTLPTYVKIENLNHSGKGNLEADLFDLTTNTTADAFSFDFDGMNYISEKKVEAEVTLGIDMAKSTYTFKDNSLKVNDFEMMFEGFIAMPDTNINMDLKFKTLKNDFKTLLSLVPGAYTQDFKDIETKGTLEFGGDVKGTYNAVQMPAFNLNLKVADAMFKYPDLPTAVNNIAMDLGIKNSDGVIDNTIIDLRKLHLDLGKNPVDAKVLIEGLTKMKVDANVKASLNLADLIKMFPIDGINLQGMFNLDATAKGMYDGVKMPVINANMSLNNGYVKSKDFPIPLEKVNMQALAKSDGTMPNSEFDLKNFSMVLDGEPFEAHAFVKNFDDIDFDVKVKGGIDLEKMTKIYPVEGMSLKGKLKADVKTAGKMSYIDAGQYDKIPTSGMLSLKDFVYETSDMPVVKITETLFTFDPKAMTLEKFSGFAGKSDMQASGTLTNYLGYILKDETLVGNLTFNSTKFDINEWLMDESAAPSDAQARTVSDSASSVPLTVVEIPKNIDFTMASSIGEVLYDNVSLKNLKGNILVQEGTVKLKDLFFNTLGGEIVANGVYDSRDVAHPKFDFDLAIKKMSIQEAAKTFVTIEKIAPLAKAMSGEFSTNFKLGGELGQDMMPLYNTLSGGGLINILKGSLTDAPVLKQLSGVTKLSDINPLNIADVLMQAEVKEGRVFFKPYNVKAGKYDMLIEGSNGLDGSLDYKVNLDLPAGAVGTQLNSALASLTGQSFSGSDKLKLNLGVGGTYNKPAIKILGAGGKSVKEQTKDIVKDNVVTNQVKEDVKEQADKIVAEARQQAENIKQEAKKQADNIRREADTNAQRLIDEAVKNAGSNPIAQNVARKAAEKTAQKLKTEAYQKADQLEAEAAKRADGIVKEAEEKANKLQ